MLKQLVVCDHLVKALEVNEEVFLAVSPGLGLRVVTEMEKHISSLSSMAFENDGALTCSGRPGNNKQLALILHLSILPFLSSQRAATVSGGSADKITFPLSMTITDLVLRPNDASISRPRSRTLLDHSLYGRRLWADYGNDAPG